MQNSFLDRTTLFILQILTKLGVMAATAVLQSPNGQTEALDRRSQVSELLILDFLFDVVGWLICFVFFELWFG